jgi:hypothetical protein
MLPVVVLEVVERLVDTWVACRPVIAGVVRASKLGKRDAMFVRAGRKCTLRPSAVRRAVGPGSNGGDFLGDTAGNGAAAIATNL